MRKIFLFVNCFLMCLAVFPQQSTFEKSGGTRSATYAEVIEWYKQLDRQSNKVLVKATGTTDAGYPIHLVLVSDDGNFDPAKWYASNKVVILINNGIHPGEPDGIDASMMLVRDIVKGKLLLPANVVLAIIPVYNIGGCLNRGSFSRVNQNGPLEYGFRGNAQNLDLNRDFTKCDSKNARTFTKIFQWSGPDILIDNHVSDGADYQHTFTLLTTQYDKLGTNGVWLKEIFEPALYKGMAEKKWDICPYVNFETASPDNGMEIFYDPPRYSSGYAALFGTIGFVPETHMLKPFKDRVQATYAFMQTVIEQASTHAAALIRQHEQARDNMMAQQQFALNWRVDSARYSTITFKGYDTVHTRSTVTGMDRFFFDHNRPFVKQVKFYDVFVPTLTIQRPKAYIIPQGWWQVIELLRLNGVQLTPFRKDTVMQVEAYHIDEYKTLQRPYEKHHKNYGLKLTSSLQQIKFLKGDFLVALNQPAARYIIEMLEPQGDDSFFSWNFFDAVLQQKEGYSDYRWEDIAAGVLKNDPLLQQALNDKKQQDTAFAANAGAQLNFVYKHSPYYEPAHLRYPVYRLIN